MGEYLESAAGPLHWQDYGGSGELLVLVHGLGGSAANWDAVGPGFARHGRAVALDLPGFGLSPPAKDWKLPTHAEALRAFTAELADNATLVGNSMGGLLAEMVASEHSDLVNALILISPATPPRLPDPRIHWPTARRLALQATPGVGGAITRHYLRTLTPEELVRLSLETITHKPGRVPMELVEAFVDLARIRQELPWAEEAVPRTAQSMAMMFCKPSRFVEMIRKITAPTLVVHGIADHIVSPASVEWMASLRPDWELVQMEDTGHTPQLDAPVRLLDVVVPRLQALQGHEITA